MNPYLGLLVHVCSRREPLPPGQQQQQPQLNTRNASCVMYNTTTQAQTYTFQATRLPIQGHAG